MFAAANIDAKNRRKLTGAYLDFLDTPKAQAIVAKNKSSGHA